MDEFSKSIAVIIMVLTPISIAVFIFLRLMKKFRNRIETLNDPESEEMKQNGRGKRKGGEMSEPSLLAATLIPTLVVGIVFAPVSLYRMLRKPKKSKRGK